MLFVPFFLREIFLIYLLLNEITSRYQEVK